MRQFADTLPTLRAPSRRPERDYSGGFDPNDIARALGVSRTSRSDEMPAAAAQAPTQDIDLTGGGPGGAFAQLRRAALDEAEDRSGPEEDAAGLGKPDAAGKTAGTRDRGRRGSPFPSLTEPSSNNVDPVGTAVEEALQKAEADKQAAVDAAKEAARLAASEELEAARASWCSQEGERLGRLLENGLTELRTSLSDTLGRIVAPLVKDAVREQTITRFADELMRLASPSANRSVLVVNGPRDLITALSDAIGDAPGITLSPSEAVEVHASLDETHVETTLTPWANDLARALGDSNVR